MASNVSGTYGKTKVRILRVKRPHGSPGTYNELCEVNVEALLEGDFLESYTDGDNSRVVPTDTIKNSCYAIAKQSHFESIEDLGLAIIRYFLNRHGHVSSVKVSLTELLWSRLIVGGSAHEHVFRHCGPETYTAVCRGYRNGVMEVESGIQDLKLMKTTQSGFENYMIDEYTSLKPTRDRIFCTSVQSKWKYQQPLPLKQFHMINERVRQRLLDVFAGPAFGGVYSKSVQETMYLIATDILKNEDVISSVELVLPNIHHFPYDLQRFGISSDPSNQILYPTDDPSGLIKCLVKRPGKAKL